MKQDHCCFKEEVNADEVCYFDVQITENESDQEIMELYLNCDEESRQAMFRNFLQEWDESFTDENIEDLVKSYGTAGIK